MLLSLAFFYFASMGVLEALQRYYESDTYTQRLKETEMKSLQEYVNEHTLKSNQLLALDEWAVKHPNIILQLYEKDKLIYDSMYGVVEKDGYLIEEIEGVSKENYIQVEFQDKLLDGVMICFPEYKLYGYLSNILLFLSFFLFFIIVMFSINRKIKYLEKIKTELDTISSGAFEQAISIKGNDDITYVAESINHLKASLVDKMEKEKEVYKTNTDLITSLSHDIRTPLTSLSGYLELALKDNTLDETTRKYIKTSFDKSIRIREITNQLFEHSLLVSKKDEIQKEAVEGNELIAQLVEDKLIDFEENGVKVVRNIQDVTSMLLVNTGLIQRLFDNIFSNIEKYADLQKEIFVEYYLKDNFLTVKISNYKKKRNLKAASSKIGMNNCRSIVKIHDGYLHVEDEKEMFTLELGLKCIQELE